MQFTDRAFVAGMRRRDDGYLVADARIARTGVQNYLGSEVGKPDMAMVRVYRPGAEVFAEDTLKSAAHRPVTNDHPAELVNSANWKEHAVGQTGDEVSGEGIFIRVPLMVSDEATIKLIEDGKREVSAGYTCDLEFTAGETPAGEAYDAVQKNIRLNHVAIVQRGRAGSQVRLGDEAAWGISPVHDHQRSEKDETMSLKTVTVDGIPIEVTDQGATVIATLQKRVTDAETKLSDATTAHAKALADKDAEIAKKDAELDAEKAKVLSDADLDKRVAARANLITVAKAIAKDVKTDGLSDAAIRKAVVVAVRGEDKVKDKSEAYIDAAFDIVVDEAAAKAGGDTFRDVVKGGLQSTDDADKTVTDAYAKMVEDMQSAHRPAVAN